MSFLASAAIAYQGAKDEQRRTADDERRAKADSRADADAAFQEEQRSRQRYDWNEVDRVRAADKADIAAVRDQFATDAAPAPDDGSAAVAQAQQQVQDDQTQADITAASAPPPDPAATIGAEAPSAPASMAKDPNAPAAPAWASAATGAQPTPGAPATSPKLAPAVVAKLQTMAPAGTAPPPAHDFNNSLAMQSELVRRKVARGDMSPEDWARNTALLNKMRDEGIHDALNLMGQGRYDDAMARYNDSGAMRGARVIDGKAGVTKINGEDVPTHFVTIRNADGTTTTMDVAKAKFQMMGLADQLSHADRATQTAMQREHFAGTLQLQRDQLAQSAKDAAAQRGIMAGHLSLAQKQFEASTPFGQIAAKEKAMGVPMSAEQKANFLGVDNLPAGTRAQLTSLLKEQDQIGQSLSKAQAEGNWSPESPGGRQLTMRSAVLNQQVADLLGSGKRAGANTDPLNLKNLPPGPAAPGGTAAAPPRAAAPLLAPVGGINPAAGPAESPIAKMIGLTGDKAMNAMVRDKARAIEDAAAAYKAEQQRYVLVAKAGDPGANADALRRLQAARAAIDSAADAAGDNKAAVLNAVGVQ